jgi:hypothetical protein
MTELLCVVDAHWSGRRAPNLPALEQREGLIIGGDLTHFKGREVAAGWLDALTASQGGAPPTFMVCGNCDLPEIEELLRERNLDLDRRLRWFRGVRLLGLSGALPFGGCPYERTEDEFGHAADELLAAAAAEPPGPTVLVSHQPPHGTNCDLTRGRHVGSHAVRDLIVRLQPDVTICGHIHEAAAVDAIGRTQIVNPGPWAAGGWVRLGLSSGRVTAAEVALAGSPPAP